MCKTYETTPTLESPRITFQENPALQLTLQPCAISDHSPFAYKSEYNTQKTCKALFCAPKITSSPTLNLTKELSETLWVPDLTPTAEAIKVKPQEFPLAKIKPGYRPNSMLSFAMKRSKPDF